MFNENGFNHDGEMITDCVDLTEDEINAYGMFIFAFMQKHSKFSEIAEVLYIKCKENDRMLKMVCLEAAHQCQDDLKKAALMALQSAIDS